MGSITFRIRDLYEHASILIALRSRLMLTYEEINAHNSKYNYNDKSELDKMIRIRSEAVDEFVNEIRVNIGELNEPYIGPIEMNKMLSKWILSGFDVISGLSAYRQVQSEMVKKIQDEGKSELIDPLELVKQVHGRYGISMEFLFDLSNFYRNYLKKRNSYYPSEVTKITNSSKLSDLFNVEVKPIDDKFIEQEYINYLAKNTDTIERIHWRNFERLTAEFFSRKKYHIELGPGSNDGGVDIRIWKKGQSKVSAPFMIVQCKRYKEGNDVEINSVKAFYTDVIWEEAQKGLIATTSRIAPGGKSITELRKYPLTFAENKEVIDWVEEMKKHS